MCATSATPTAQTHGISGLLRDWRDQMSWGRVCAAVALAVAVIQEFRGASVPHLVTWLSVATGTYTASKITEMVAATKQTTIEPDREAQ